jgi:hypothetical protein
MDINNGIWLCQNHARLIDRDVRAYGVADLMAMKQKAEEEAMRRLQGFKLVDLDDYLEALRGVQVLSYTGKVTYYVAEVVRDSHVSLTGGRRKRPSVLRWADIQLVFSGRNPKDGLTPSDVDMILQDQKSLDSSTMCALVLAMWGRTR